MISIEGESLEGKPPPDSLPPPIRVVVTDLDIGFMSIIHLMIKFFFAAIPAVICIWAMLIFLAAFMKGCMG